MAFLLMASLTFFGTVDSFAQSKKTTTVNELTSTLEQTSVQNGLINVGNLSVNVSQVTIQDLINVQNVLNNADIRILTNALNNNEVLKNITVDLTNVLRNAKILNQNQIIVGILSDQSGIRFVRQNAQSVR